MDRSVENHPEKPMVEGIDAPATAKRPYTGLIILGLFLAITIAIFASGVHRYLSFSTLIAYQDDLHGLVTRDFLSSCLLFLGIYTLAVAFSVPGATVLTVTSGFLFGGVLGSLLSVVGSTLGCAGLYLIAKTAIGSRLQRSLGSKLARINEGFQEGVWSYLFFLRFVPIFPFWAVNLAGACLQVPFVAFLVTTFFGVMPGTIAFSFAGASFGGLVKAQGDALKACKSAGVSDCGVSFDPSQVATPQVLATFVALGVMALIPLAVKAWRNRKMGVVN